MHPSANVVGMLIIELLWAVNVHKSPVRDLEQVKSGQVELSGSGGQWETPTVHP